MLGWHEHCAKRPSELTPAAHRFAKVRGFFVGQTVQNIVDDTCLRAPWVHLEDYGDHERFLRRCSLSKHAPRLTVKANDCC